MIESVETGEQFGTIALPVVLRDLASLGRGWRFRWIDEIQSAEVVKLIAPSLSDRILGLMAFRRHKGFIEITLLESNPADVGQSKTFSGIAGSLIAFAAQVSFEIGGEGFVAIVAKTKLVEHYVLAYGFQRVGKTQTMSLGTIAAANLIKIYGGRPIDE